MCKDKNFDLRDLYEFFHGKNSSYKFCMESLENWFKYGCTKKMLHQYLIKNWCNHVEQTDLTFFEAVLIDNGITDVNEVEFIAID